jgi:hypothetical protein
MCQLIACVLMYCLGLSCTILQEEAVSAISRAIRRARVGLKNPNRPIASFIFAGPTGVGKSELAKTLASYYFGSEEAMVSAAVLLCYVVLKHAVLSENSGSLCNLQSTGITVSLQTCLR